MKEPTHRWEDIDHAKAEADVFSIQKRIFHASAKGENAKVHKLQRLLLNSFSARYLAVRRVAQVNRGRRTPGVDGKHSLTGPQKLRLVHDLKINQTPLPLRRTHIPKANGKTRPLSIPVIADRALQALIAMALEPQWEAIYAPHLYGFRRGRGVHDAVAHIRQHIQRSPKWVLDGDISAFFDNVLHKALLKKLDTLPCIRRAIRRMFKSGVIENFKWTRSDRGIPQGGGLSPLLGNIILTGMEQDLAKAFPPSRIINGQPVGKPPRVVIYADDLLVFHDRREVIEEIKEFLTEWLAGYGLAFNEEKTRIVHTLERENGNAGFEFLGFRFRQRRVGRHQRKAWFNGILTLITPSPKAVKALKERISEIIMETRPNPKRNAAYAHQKAKGRPDHQEILIAKINPILRGWANHFRFANSKETFSDLDHWLWLKLWQWTKRHYGKTSRRELVKHFFNDGAPWTFKVRYPASGKPTELLKLSSVKIVNHKLVRAGKSYFDGDWLGWATLRGAYPGISKPAARALRWQHGRCPRCGKKIEKGQRLALINNPDANPHNPNRLLVHHTCTTPSEKEGGCHSVGLRTRDVRSRMR